MDRELARKRPATIIAPPAKATVQRLDVSRKLVIRADSKSALAASVTHLFRAGEIERQYRSGKMGNTWVAEVVMKPPRSWLRKHAAKICWSAALVGVLALLAWLVDTLIRAAMAAMAGVSLGGLALVVLGSLALLLAAGRRTITVIQKVTIK